MKELNGSEVVGFIKERQAYEVRSLIQAHDIQPKLAIVRTNQESSIDLYLRLKKKYGQDIRVLVDVYDCSEQSAEQLILKLNEDDRVHGIIVQLPLVDTSKTDEIVNLVASSKDVDGLAAQTDFVPATPTAILWLLAAYNIDLLKGQIAVVGQGRLVGGPLTRILVESGHNVVSIDITTPDPGSITRESAIIITAVGKCGIITPDMVSPGTVVVDAGVATDSDSFTGDITDEVRQIADVKVTPIRGGVGPLTVAALFENVITAAKRSIHG